MAELSQLDEQERNRLIALIAEKHGVLLGRDDPILIVHTLHNELVSRLANSEAEIIDRFSGRIEEVSSRWERDAKDKAEQVLSAALTASSGAFEKRLKDATAIVISDIEKAGQKTAKDILDTTESLRKSLYVVLGAVAAVLLAALFVLFASMHH